MPVIDVHNIYKRHGDQTAVGSFRWEYGTTEVRLLTLSIVTTGPSCRQGSPTS